MALVIVGYLCGVLHKILNPDPGTGRISPVVWLYLLNLGMVVVDLLLYIRYRNNHEYLTVSTNRVLDTEGTEES